MTKGEFNDAVQKLMSEHTQLVSRKNQRLESRDGIYHRFEHPVMTPEHIPVTWRFDLNRETNPRLLERIGFNATFNAGAIRWKGKYLLVPRVEGRDRKSFFAVAESPTGIDQFKFWDRPVTMPETAEPDTNVYDMRLTLHEDGWIYGLFCTERKDADAPGGDTSSAVAQCGIARTLDLVSWERLPDLVTSGGQQRNVVLHSEFVNGRYALYTRPQEGFIETGSGGGIGLGFVETMERAELVEERIIDRKIYHTVFEVKNGLGPAPIKTEHGWLQLAHGVRGTAAGLRYVLYLFMTSLEDPSKVIHKPAGYFMAPVGSERVGDVSNVLFSNGWIVDEDSGTVYIYYASSDTRLHVATSTVDILLDYCMNTPEDGLRSAASVQTVNELIDSNLALEKDME